MVLGDAASVKAFSPSRACTISTHKCMQQFKNPTPLHYVAAATVLFCCLHMGTYITTQKFIEDRVIFGDVILICEIIRPKP